MPADEIASKLATIANHLVGKRLRSIEVGGTDIAFWFDDRSKVEFFDGVTINTKVDEIVIGLDRTLPIPNLVPILGLEVTGARVNRDTEDLILEMGPLASIRLARRPSRVETFVFWFGDSSGFVAI